jgi:hypothetical protein
MIKIIIIITKDINNAIFIIVYYTKIINYYFSSFNILCCNACNIDIGSSVIGHVKAEEGGSSNGKGGGGGSERSEDSGIGENKDDFYIEYKL